MKKLKRVRAGLQAVRRRLWPRKVTGRIAVLLGSVVLAALLILLTMFASIVIGHIAGALWGAVNIFNSPSAAPPEAEMVGIYHLHPKGAQLIKSLSSVSVKSSTLELCPDHTALLQNVYDYVDTPFGNGQFYLCKISGSGFWHVSAFTGIEISIELQQSVTVNGPSPCASEKWVSYAILGRGTVHGLWSYIGDPDSDAGFKYYR